MRFEMELVKQQHQAHDLPVRDKFIEAEVKTEELISRRRVIRLETDNLIHEALLTNDILKLATATGTVMTVTAGVCVQLGIEPTLEDFLTAAKELIEDARVPVDKGLHQREWRDAIVGAVMLEIVCRGICAVVSIPYKDVFELLHNAYLKGEQPDIEALKELLRKAGHGLEKDASPDTPA